MLAGDVAVHLSAEGRDAEVGCTLAPDHQGHGYAREAVGAVVELLREVGVERVEAEIDPRNRASIALFEAVGFVHQRTDVRAVEIRGEWCDSARYGRRL